MRHTFRVAEKSSSNKRLSSMDERGFGLTVKSFPPDLLGRWKWFPERSEILLNRISAGLFGFPSEDCRSRISLLNFLRAVEPSSQRLAAAFFDSLDDHSSVAVTLRSRGSYGLSRQVSMRYDGASERSGSEHFFEGGCLEVSEDPGVDPWGSRVQVLSDRIIVAVDLAALGENRSRAFHLATEAVIEVVGAGFGFVVERESLGGRVRALVGSSFACQLTKGREFDIEHEALKSLEDLRISNFGNLIDDILKSGDPLFRNTCKEGDTLGELAQWFPPLKSFFGFPIAHSGRVIGVIGLANRKGGFGVDEHKIVELAASAIANSLFFQSLQSSGARELSFFVKRACSLEREIRKMRGESAALRKAIESTFDGVALLDKDGRFLAVNRGHVLMFGYQREDELIGESWQILYYKSQVDWFVTYVMPELYSGKGQWHGETIGKKKDGSTFNEEVSLTLLDGGGMICACRDVTDRVQSSLALSEANQRLSQSEELRKMSLALISHELRTPLTAVLGNLEALRTVHDGLTLEQGESLSIATQSAHHLEEIINDVLLISGNEQESIIFSDVLINWNSLVDVVVGIVKPVADACGVVIDASVEVGELPFHGDDRRVKQILINLLQNSIDASRREATVSLRVYRVEHGVEISVVDRGCGITKEELENVFQPFITYHHRSGSRRTKGRGLGLTLVRTFVERMGGEITMESEVGKGSIFLVFLPQNDGALLARNGLGPGVEENVVDTRLVRVEGIQGLQIAFVDQFRSRFTGIFEISKALGAFASGYASVDELLKDLHSKEFDVVFLVEPSVGAEGIDTVRSALPDTLIVGLVDNLTASASLRGVDMKFSMPFESRKVLGEVAQRLSGRENRSELIGLN